MEVTWIVESYLRCFNIDINWDNQITDFNDSLADNIKPIMRALNNNLLEAPQPNVSNYKNQAEDKTSLESYPS
jgi:hypothetical protein